MELRGLAPILAKALFMASGKSWLDGICLSLPNLVHPSPCAPSLGPPAPPEMKVVPRMYIHV